MSGITQALLMSKSGKPLEFVGGAATSGAVAAPSISLTSLTGGVASAAAADDLVIAVVAFSNGTDRNISCTTSGYTEMADLFADGASDCQMGVYYKRLTAADTSVAFNIVVSVPSVMAVHVWRNSNASSPLDAATTTSTSTSGGSPDAPAITTTTNNAVVLAIGSVAAAAATALTVPSGMSNLTQIRIASAIDVAVGIASASVAAAGVYDPNAFGGGTGDNCAATVAIRPA